MKSLPSLVNSILGTEYSGIDIPQVSSSDCMEKVSADNTSLSSVDPYSDLMEAVSSIDSCEEYEMNQVEKLAAAAYLLEMEKTSEGLPTDAGGLKKLINSPKGKGLAIGLVLGWLANSILSNNDMVYVPTPGPHYSTYR